MNVAGLCEYDSSSLFTLDLKIKTIKYILGYTNQPCSDVAMS